MVAHPIDVELFCKEIKQRPALWMTSHPKFWNKKFNNQMWKEIQQIFPKSTEIQLRKKYKNLRDTYRKELKKILPEYNHELESVGESQYVHFDALDFLRHELVPQSEDAPDFEEIKMDCQFISENDTQETESRISLPDSPNPGSHFDSDPCNSTCTRKTKLQEQTLEIERKKLKLLELELSTKTQEQRSDNYHFLMSILPEMDKLHPIQSFRLRNKINQALLDEMSLALCGDPLGQSVINATTIVDNSEDSKPVILSAKMK